MLSFDKNDNKDIKLAQEQLKLTGDIARKCLELEVFQTYKKKYEKVEAGTIETLHRLTETYKQGRMSLEEYGSRMFGFMTELKCLKSLLVNVKNDAKKGLEDVKER